ncbi:MAG: hypothetical protein AB1656_13370 [Candidatus Omnitrophota bacterium]
MPEYFIVLLVLFAIVFLAIMGFIQAQKRKKELMEWAQSNGLRFHPDNDHAMDNRYNSFSCLQEGSHRYAYNIMEGEWKQRGLCAFDYHYETYSTDSKGNRETHHHYFSAAAVKTEWPMKPLFIRPEGFFDKITEFLGFDDIDFESAEFSRQFYVKSPDKRWAFDVIHQRAMEFLMNAPRFQLDFQGYDIIAYRDKTFCPADFEAAIDVIHGLLDLLPDYLIRELKKF